MWTDTHKQMKAASSSSASAAMSAIPSVPQKKTKKQLPQIPSVKNEENKNGMAATRPTIIQGHQLQAQGPIGSSAPLTWSGQV